MAQKFAVFDIDGTVVRTSLFLQIVDQLMLDGQLPIDARQQLDDKLAAYRQREHQDAFADYTTMAVDLLFNNITKLSVAAYKAAVNTVIQNTKGHSYVFTRDLARTLKDQGYFLIALSGSEMYAVEQFAQHYDFDLAIGETYHEQDGFFNGEVDNVIHTKDVFVKQLVEAHELTYDDSVAVGDSQSDAKMLALVTNPIAFNPEQRLLATAKEHGWKIVIERKNVIYELECKDPGGNHGPYILA